jgi:DNA-binding CsgD family transcriptional regulator/tetratricopeptide (TPR) repeat protein
MAIIESAPTALLLEREEPLATLHAALAGAVAGQGRLVFVGGEAGVGKTSLVRRFCAELPAGTGLFWGGCDPLATPRPLGPFLEIAETAGIDGPVDPWSTPHNVAAAVLELVQAQNAVVVVEDAHWADEGTLDVLRLFARKLPTTSSLVLVTYRDDELARDHPLRIALGDISTAAAVERLAVRPLSRSGVAELAGARSVDLDVVWRLTAGNPFYVTELLANGAEEVPDTVRDLVLARVAQLGRQATAVVEAAAVAPPSLDAELLLAVCGEAADSVDECLASGVLHVVDGGVAFRHELSRAAVEESLSPARRLALHRSVLLALTDARRAHADLARVAHHAAAAADRDAVLRYAPAAAEQAASVGAYREAAAQYARALRFGDDLAPGERAELLEGRSRALYLADDQTEAIDVIREAIRCRQAEDAPLKEARALTELADYMWCRGYNGEANAAVDRASELAAGRPEEREHAYVLHTQAMQALYRGELDVTREHARRALEAGERFGDELIAGHARVTIGSATRGRDLESGLRVIEEAVETARRNGEHEVAARGMNALVYRPIAFDRHDLAERYIDDAIEYCTEHTQDLWRINVQAIAARWALDRGRWDDAVRHAVAVIDDPRESPWTHHEALCVLSLVRARRGDPGAGDALARAAAVGVPSEDRFAHVDLAVAAAEIAWLERRPGDVDSATAEMLSVSVEEGDGEAASRLLLWRRFAGLQVEVAPGGSGSPYGLALSGRWTQAAEEWRRRSCPYEAALALSQTGEVEALRKAHAELQRLGARPLATVVARELRGLGVRDLPRGPRATTRANEAALTPRELEVLALIAEGLRNADVAERLVVSRRTVDHHVSAILRKLQASSRGEAVASAQRLGLLAGM